MDLRVSVSWKAEADKTEYLKLQEVWLEDLPLSCFQKAGQADRCHCHWLNPTCWCNNPKVNDSSMEIQDPVYKNENVPKSHTQTGTRWQLNWTVFSIQGRFLNGTPHTPPHYHSPALLHRCGCAFSPRTASIPWALPGPGLSPTFALVI